jgi:predicted membrane chloride channel (bestrophin family)
MLTHTASDVLTRMQCLDVYECRVSETHAERSTVCTCMWQLSKCIGGGERIVQTPVPLHYARHTGRFMGLFILTLPFILVDDMVRHACQALSL